MAQSMELAVIGGGQLGSALARQWAEAGHKLLFGLREPEESRIRALLDLLSGRGVAYDVPTAVKKADVVVLAVGWNSVPTVLPELGDGRGRVLIDCTNPLNAAIPDGFDSAAEWIAANTRDWRVVKAFNTTGANNIENHDYAEGLPSSFVCGNDAAARELVVGLGEDLGFEMIDAGELENAHALEELAHLWVILAQENGRDIAWRLMRR